MNIIAIQLDIAWHDRAANLRRAGQIIRAARPAAGDLIVLPEMLSSGFSMDVAAVAEGPDCATERFLSQVAADSGACVLGGVVSRAADGRGLNEAVLFGPAGDELLRYCKVHPFGPAGEDKHYRPGDAAAVAKAGELTVAPLICYDLRFPEVFRAGLERGAELFAVIASWPAQRQDHWRALLIARAIENQAFVVGVNRCGQDPSASYAGGSIIVDPRGAVLAEADASEQALSAGIDRQSLLDYRRAFPVLADRRKAY